MSCLIVLTLQTVLHARSLLVSRSSLGIWTRELMPQWPAKASLQAQLIFGGLMCLALEFSRAEAEADAVLADVATAAVEESTEAMVSSPDVRSEQIWCPHIAEPSDALDEGHRQAVATSEARLERAATHDAQAMDSCDDTGPRRRGRKPAGLESPPVQAPLLPPPPLPTRAAGEDDPGKGGLDAAVDSDSSSPHASPLQPTASPLTPPSRMLQARTPSQPHPASSAEPPTDTGADFSIENSAVMWSAHPPRQSQRRSLRRDSSDSPSPRLVGPIPASSAAKCGGIGSFGRAPRVVPPPSLTDAEAPASARERQVEQTQVYQPRGCGAAPPRELSDRRPPQSGFFGDSADEASSRAISQANAVLWGDSGMHVESRVAAVPHSLPGSRPGARREGPAAAALGAEMRGTSASRHGAGRAATGVGVPWDAATSGVDEFDEYSAGAGDTSEQSGGRIVNPIPASAVSRALIGAPAAAVTANLRSPRGTTAGGQRAVGGVATTAASIGAIPAPTGTRLSPSQWAPLGCAVALGPTAARSYGGSFVPPQRTAGGRGAVRNSPQTMARELSLPERESSWNSAGGVRCDALYCERSAPAGSSYLLSPVPMHRELSASAISTPKSLLAAANPREVALAFTPTSGALSSSPTPVRSQHTPVGSSREVNRYPRVG
eukprot:TRINITY_DN11507_c0_g2_i1.p1 TRINITY_DN11507_c0_g2~~TRINITY_DN11507_c0_g2_i1.p1  ORF type:complete len:663 (-),score=85.52 TRINITY_DN11507_c0_g2_i1:61-2049(-)